MSKHLKSFDSEWELDRRKKLNKANSLRSLRMCKKCHTFYYKNSWHFDNPTQLNGEGEPLVAVRFTQCPDCLEEEMAIYNAEMVSV